ncbi:DNA polymerase III subunit delta [Bifidobacterium catulorum]|uniref:DNA-directed DNA polymerase n=1 Tax=Bifidobacterium catulorum TaxID=1630173 RepID=A0A2U2MRK7_9BIFI|nr:DNA polymerase III subunit delta [Bifidobacterium catulorum]PWG59459.1 DNA polymerase III subunit delta [Bifidobacterium catulorum]
MPASASHRNSPMSIVFGGDGFLNEQTVKDLCHQACERRPDAELIELDAASCDVYAFDEAVSPSLLSDAAVVRIDNLQSADDRLGDAMVDYLKHCDGDAGCPTVLVCRHEGGMKGKRIVDALKRAGADVVQVPDLKKADAKINYVYQCFERRGRRVDPVAAQQLVNVLGGRTGELSAMCAQLCFDFDDDPIGVDRVNQYLTASPQVTGFAVADKAVEGRAAEAIVAMRSAIAQGTDPIALIGALAMKLRTMAKASAVRVGTISQAEANINPWVLKNAGRQLSGWSSDGMRRCIGMLAWADEQSKTNGGDQVYALERAIETIAAKGRN